MNSLDMIQIETLPSNNVVCNSNNGMPSIVNNNKNLYYNFSEIQNLNTSDALLFPYFERTLDYSNKNICDKLHN